MDLQIEKLELIELFGRHFATYHNLPPLASRILGTLILDCCDKGLTFEELVERMSASKSSVSTNLNLLLKTGKVTYYTVSGDRKKYFKPCPFAQRLDNYQKMLEFEKHLVGKLIDYRENTASTAEEIRNLSNIKSYKNFVIQAEILLLKTIDNFKEIEKSNPF
jgi:DNA-binding transcriptional regulator GbsR (MarR family)